MKTIALLVGLLVPATAMAQDPGYAPWVNKSGAVKMTGPLKLAPLAADPYTCASPVYGATYFNTGSGALKLCSSTGWAAVGGGASTAFSALTSGTGTGAYLIGSGGSLGTSGTGSITATAVPATGLTGTVPTARLGSGVANGGTYLRGDQSWAAPSSGFDALTTGSNTIAAMTCGTGCAMGTSGSGTITATGLTGAVSGASSLNVAGNLNLTASGATLTLNGASSGSAILQAASAAGGTFTLPNVSSGTVVSTGDTGSVSNAMLAGSIASTKLASMTSTQWAAVVSDETGTGSVVFSNSPTFMTPVLGVASATSISATTFSGALAGNATTATNATTAATLTGTSASTANTLVLSASDSTSKLPYLTLTNTATSTGSLRFQTAAASAGGWLAFAGIPTTVSSSLPTVATSDGTTTTGLLGYLAGTANSNSKLYFRAAPTGTTQAVNEVFSINGNGAITGTRVALTSGTPNAMLALTGAAHTGLTLAEFNHVNFDFSSTQTFNTSGGGGTLALQRGMLYQASAYASDVATTITLAVGAEFTTPTAGTNMTVTRRLASRFVSNTIGTTQNGGIAVQNATAATNNSQSYSPLTEQEGQGWGTGADTSQSVKWATQVRPVQAATNPTSALDFMSSINGGAYATQLSVSSAGALSLGVASTTTGQLKLYNSGSANATIIQAGSGSALTWTTPTAFGAAGCAWTDAAGNGTLSCVVPSGGVTSVTGTANQITSSGGNTPVLSLPSAVTLPGSLTVTTTTSHLGVVTNTLSGLGTNATSTGASLILTNATGADATNTVQNSPWIELSGAAWKSNATAASQVNYGLFGFVPVSRAASTYGRFDFMVSSNGAAPTLGASLVSTTSILSFGSTAVGANTSALPTGLVTAYGQGAASRVTNGGNGIVAIGNLALNIYGAGSGNGQVVAIGDSALSGTNGDNNTAVGYRAGYDGSASNTSTGNLYLGSITSSASGINSSIAMGVNAAITASHQWVVGGWDGIQGSITDVYIGKGVTSTSAAALVNINVTGGSGTDSTATGLNLAAGISTGTGAVAPLTFQTTTLGSHGSTAQTLSTRLTISGTAITSTLGYDIGTAGKTLSIKEGSNACMGSGTLVGGTTTITTTCAGTGDRILITDTTTGALTNVGTLVVSAKNSGNFVVTSTIAIDTSTFDWFVFHAL